MPSQHNTPSISPIEQLQSRLAHTFSGEIDGSDAARALYASDASNYRQVPLGVLFPKDDNDIVAAGSACQALGLPLLMRGAGTSQNGQCVNEAIVLDCSRYLDQVLDIDTEAQTALIQPGIVCDSLKAQAEQQGLTFGPDPATHSRCTLGGMIGNNSCGPRSMLAGKTVENVLALEVLTSDGTRFWTGPTDDQMLERILARNDRQAAIYRELLAIRDEYADEIRQRYPDIKRRVSGYNLDQLLPEKGFNVARALVGSEGTCVSILQARVKLIKKPALTQLLVLGFDDIFIAGDAVADILPFKPIAMEGLDWEIVGGLNDRNLKQREVALLPEGRAWILTELAAETREALTEQTRLFIAAMESNPRITSIKAFSDSTAVTDIWSIREQGASATSMSLDPEGTDPIVGWEDTAVDPLQLGAYLREFKALVNRYGYSTSLYGHFGDGCIHARITFDTRSEHGVEQWRRFSAEIAALVIRFGGSLSGEHGDGQAKAEFLPLMFGERLMDAFRRFKRAWDPDLRMNPGKLIDAWRMDENLRYGPDYQTPAVQTRLQFVEDPQGFGRSTERCIGMGKCRADTGAMCPSYQATHEERYSTRGRAHLLHELVRGETIISQGFADQDIADSMEHCLSCKACKSECPTQVDIAAYKAEFMYRHYQIRKRPMAATVLAQIGTLLPWLSKAPRLINTLQRTLPGRAAAHHLLGLSPDKTLPSLAVMSFSRWAMQQSDRHDEHFLWFGNPEHTPVILWNDSVNNHYRPSLLKSAVTVLCRLGFTVGVARQAFCCGRPLYEHGLLDQAEQQLQSILDGFARHSADNPVLVLEPSCLSVFRDELLRLFPDNETARRLSKRCSSVTQFLSTQNLTVTSRLARGILHVHCHDKSLRLADEERAWMQRCFEHIDEVEQGCCGMAGTYGMRKKTRAIGLTLFARKLQPAIDAADVDTVIVANGFSCHEQITDQTARRVLHPIEVLETCLGKPA